MKHKKIWLLSLFSFLLLVGRSDTQVPTSLFQEPEPTDDQQNSVKQQTVPKLPSKPGTDPAPFTPQILAENGACSVAVTGVEIDDIWGYQLQMELMNKTAHRNLIFMIQDVYVNNMMCDPSWACEVPAGKRIGSEMIWFPELLEEKGISKVSELMFTFQIYDSENLERTDLLKETIVLFQE